MSSQTQDAVATIHVRAVLTPRNGTIRKMRKIVLKMGEQETSLWPKSLTFPDGTTDDTIIESALLHVAKTTGIEITNTSAPEITLVNTADTLIAISLDYTEK